MEFFIIHVLETGTMQGSRDLSGLKLFRKRHLLIDLSKSTSIALERYMFLFCYDQTSRFYPYNFNLSSVTKNNLLLKHELDQIF